MSTFFRSLFFGAAFFLFAGACSAQPLPDSLTKKIDAYFMRWNNPLTPGCAVGIVRNDSLIYAKGYGMANLEYKIPISAETIFHMASVSKQFTAFAIVLLARQGKLQLDDDVRKYLTWFPDLKAKITIRNLLNHTSGIRDQWQLLAIAGTRIDDVITQEQIVKILSKQTALDFMPGEQYSYSNSNFTMLSEIVRSVSGQTLRKFCDSAIFKPLGMTKTHIHDDYTEVVPNRAYSYYRHGPYFANSILSYSNSGATSLFTNVDDMSKWIRNFYEHKVGDQADINTLTQKGKLNNGKELSYALGIVHDTYRGWDRYQHSGGDAGFRTFISVIPSMKMGFIVFSNLADMGPNQRADEVAALFIPDKSDPKKSKADDKNETAGLLQRSDSLNLVRYLGRYISEEGELVGLAINNNKLYSINDGDSNVLIRSGKDEFLMSGEPGVIFSMAVKGSDTLMDLITPDHHFKMKKYDPHTVYDDQALAEYVGRYYSPELDCSYSLELRNHGLVLTNSKYDDQRVRITAKDHLLNDNWWMSHLEIIRDASRKVIGFEVNSNRVMHVKFDKVR